jgi:mono/diheme cytochrome c family protein
VAPIVPFIVPATLTRIVYNGAPPRAAVIRVAATADSNTEQTTDDQKDAADSVAGNATDKDKSFKAAATPTAVADGRTIFNGTCNHCHGPDAVQSVKKIDLRLLHHRYGGAMDQVYHYTVTHGRESKGMPNWSGVFTEDDFSKILAFLHSVQTE